MLRPAILAGIAALAAAPQPILAAPIPANSVQCTYDLLGTEDREIAMVLLFLRHSETEPDRASWLRGVEIADRMLNAANVQCRIAYRWTASQAANSRQYAFNSLLVEAMRQLLEAEGTHSAEPIDRYFAQHADDLQPDQEPATLQGRAFTAFLLVQGWDGENEDDLRRARKYLDSLITRQGDIRGFAASPIRRSA